MEYRAIGVVDHWPVFYFEVDLIEIVGTPQQLARVHQLTNRKCWVNVTKLAVQTVDHTPSG